MNKLQKLSEFSLSKDKQQKLNGGLLSLDYSYEYTVTVFDDREDSTDVRAYDVCYPV